MKEEARAAREAMEREREEREAEGKGADGWKALSRGVSIEVLSSEADAPIAYLLDATSGQVLYQREIDRRFMPASITKVMTTFLAFEWIDEGRLVRERIFGVRPETFRQWHRKGSTMFLAEDARVSVDDLLHGVTTVSANDGAVVLVAHDRHLIDATCEQLWRVDDGHMAPFDGDLKLRYEAFYRNNRRIPARQETVEFPAQGLPYPRIRKGTGVMHVYAAHTKRLRCRNALAIDSLPPTGKDGQPRVIRHRFELQPIPGAAQPPEKQ